MSWLSLAVLLAAGATAEAQARPPNPDAHCLLALAHAQALPEADRAYARYLSFWSTTESALWDQRRYLSWWVHQMTFERAVTLPQEVQGSDGRMVYLDLRWYGWPARAWQAVARREPFTREPWVTHASAEPLRLATGCSPEPQAKDGTVPVVAMVRADWFLRETLETRRSPSYYDLLFGEFRFTEGRAEKPRATKVPYEVEETVQDKDAQGNLRYYSNGQPYMVIRKTTKYREEAGKAEAAPGFVDFPRDITDWEKAFGVDVIKTFGKDREISLDFGAVVAGGRDDPANGSIVALNNRLLVMQTGAFGRLAMRTFDTIETSGQKDYSETLIFKGGKFRKGDGAEAENDGGEVLAYLPNGGQAALLVDGAGKRVEEAAALVANDTADRRLNQGVRNPGSCWTCHAGSGGLIPPRDLEGLDRKAGIRRKFKDPAQEQRYREFFETLEEGTQQYTQPYQQLIGRTTAHPELLPVLNQTARPWSGDDIARITGQIRDQYDAPVDAARAARELGTSPEAFKYLCSRSPRHRLLQLLQGRPVPSRTWEVDSFRDVAVLLAAHRGDAEYQKLYGGAP